MSLPLAEVAVWHYVRRPLDVVVSALWYHMQLPAPETWIEKEASVGRGGRSKGEACATSRCVRCAPDGGELRSSAARHARLFG